MVVAVVLKDILLSLIYQIELIMVIRNLNMDKSLRME
jgi:hypothetical protein